jgi:hypothetical protein
MSDLCHWCKEATATVRCDECSQRFCFDCVQGCDDGRVRCEEKCWPEFDVLTVKENISERRAMEMQRNYRAHGHPVAVFPVEDGR